MVRTPEQAQSLPWISLVTYYRERLLPHDAQGRAHAVDQPTPADRQPVRGAAGRARGLGAAVVSAWLVAEDLAQGRLVQLLPDWRGTGAPGARGVSCRAPAAARLRAFIDAMKAALPQLHGMRPAPR